MGTKTVKCPTCGSECIVEGTDGETKFFRPKPETVNAPGLQGAFNRDGIYITTEEGGMITFFEDFLLDLSIIYKMLTEERIKIGDSYYSFLFGTKVHAVFIVKNGHIQEVWDSKLNGLRP